MDLRIDLQGAPATWGVFGTSNSFSSLFKSSLELREWKIKSCPGLVRLLLALGLLENLHVQRMNT